MGHTERSVSRRITQQLSWLISRFLSPLPVLHPAPILAFSTFVIIAALIGRIPLSAATRMTSELADRFGLDMRFSEANGVTGDDLEPVKRTPFWCLGYAQLMFRMPGRILRVLQGGSHRYSSGSSDTGKYIQTSQHDRR